MATRKRLTLENWIREAMLEEKDGKRKCSMFSLVHLVGLMHKEVHSVRFASGKSWTPEELAVMFRGRAEGFCQDMSGTQQFQLLAFYGQNESESAQLFTVSQAIDPTSPLTSEPPTPEGRMAAGMRRDDMLMQQVYRRQQVLDDHSNALISLQSRQIVDLTSSNIASFNMMKELLMEKALNTHKMRMDELDYERSSGERKKWMGMIPMLANTILGREIFPQSNADTVLMEQIVESIDENAIMALAQFVKPELMGPLMERFTQIQKKKTLEQNNRSSALAPVTHGEDDAVGGGE